MPEQILEISLPSDQKIWSIIEKQLTKNTAQPYDRPNKPTQEVRSKPLPPHPHAYSPQLGIMNPPIPYLHDPSYVWWWWKGEYLYPPPKVSLSVGTYNTYVDIYLGADFPGFRCNLGMYLHRPTS